MHSVAWCVKCRGQGLALAGADCAPLVAQGGLSLCDAMLECHPDDTEIRASVQEIRRVLLR